MAGGTDILEVAIVGEGISPRAVPVRALSVLLAAAAAALEAAASELDVPLHTHAVTKVREGSAAYQISTPGTEPAVAIARLPAHESAIHYLYEAARVRGVGYKRPLRKALADLHDAGAIGAGVRLEIMGPSPAPAILLASPAEEENATTFEETAEVFGIVVAIQAGRDTPKVRLRLDSGTHVFSAEHAVATDAAKLWSRNVRARVVFRRALDPEDDEPISLEEVSASEEISFFDAIDDLRREVMRSGIVVDGDDWLDEAEGD